MSTELHPHRNVNALHRAEQAAAGFNMWLALLVTRAVSTMFCAYIFLLIAIIGFPGWHATPNQYVQWISSVVIQLVMLSILAVQAKIASRHLELQADEQFRDVELIMSHLDSQDEKILAILDRLDRKSATMTPDEEKVLKSIIETYHAGRDVVSDLIETCARGDIARELDRAPHLKRYVDSLLGLLMAMHGLCTIADALTKQEGSKQA